MSKLIVLSFGNGDFQQGFHSIILQIWEDRKNLTTQFIGSLPPAPDIWEIYNRWQSEYRVIGTGFRPMPQKTATQYNVGRVTAQYIISKPEIEVLGESLVNNLNQWLNSESFVSIKNKLFKLLTDQEIQLIIETENTQLQRLPWHLWDFFERYPKAEVSFSNHQFDLPSTKLFSSRTHGRLLVILGDRVGIERIKLKELPDIEVVTLVEPTPDEFSKQLWDYQGWDILFFAGQSVTETSGKEGKIFINRNESRTISQLKHSLKKSVSLGLKLAIFNYSSGLEIVKELDELHIPYVIAMREPVPDMVAKAFLKYFLLAFSQGNPLHLAVREAREKLQSIEANLPGASWLPVLFQNPSLSPFTWQDLPGLGVESKMFNWVVMLKDTQEDLPETMGRRALYQAGKERTTQFQRGLENWLRKKGAMSEVKAIAPPTTFPVIMLKCTQKVARLIESYPGVDFVLPDGGDIELTR